MHFTKKFITLALVCATLFGYSQSTLITHNKPLAFVNPAIQNMDYYKFIISGSVRNAPLTEIDREIFDYFAIAETQFREGGIRVGAYSGNILSNSTRFQYHKGYASFGVIPEESSRITFGIDAGVYTDEVVEDYLDSLDKPIDFRYAQTSITQFTLGLGINFEFENFNMGVGVNNLNKPSVIEEPSLPFRDFTEPDPNDPDEYRIKDTFHNVGTEIYDLNFTFNFRYHYTIGEHVKASHTLLVNQPNIEGATYVAFQNMFQGKSAEGGFGITRLRGSSFYNANIGLKIDKSIWFNLGVFVSDYTTFDKSTREFLALGYQPLFEGNLQFRL